jgi:hypothetical protein
MRFILAGYGKFGRSAFEKLTRDPRSSHITVIDPASDFSDIEHMNEVTLVRGDAVSYLAQASESDADDMIIPMTPFHLAARYMQAVTRYLKEGAFPKTLEGRLPNPIKLSEGVVCFSLADHLCPDGCEEGDECTVTGESRNPPMYRRLDTLFTPDRPLITARSAQILPGVGGYRMRDLLALPQRAENAAKLLIATACRCHGIMTALDRIR